MLEEFGATTKQVTATRNYNNLSFEEIEELIEPAILPSDRPEQTCLRCGNFFPSGLKRCTACGLAVADAHQEPGAALPWRGYERGIIECPGCNFENSDRMARNNKIQKCKQCARVIYIPSGLYSKKQHLPIRYKRRRANPLFALLDLIGAGLSKLYRSKLRWPILATVFILGIASLLGLFNVRQQQTKITVVDPPIKTYYNSVVAINNRVTNALTEFNNDSGGMPLQNEFDDRRNPTKRTRFVIAANRVLGVVESSIEELRKIPDVAIGAENFQSKMLNMLYLQQKFYAQLKDSIEQGTINRSDAERKTLWDNAFKMKEDVKVATKDEGEALTNLSTLALKATPVPSTATPGP